ncbi:nitrate reductase molybdenum cofactor assembly chaperone [Aliikangiella maris]|uniref:Nitrate reductase molybdenum cofactor assembly chaperone n=2 Tax=Aliikangiella maris TaxID=3162458 RepID=A0ABV2BRS0_9GAMM
MLILKVLSRLLDYPSQDLFTAKVDLLTVVEQSVDISPQTKQQLTDFISNLVSKDIYDAQERYDLLFDRGRSLSLLLFEHVHGESRDRGQAMVNLLDVYRTNGFEIHSSQLPDYIPLYLEFLSEQPKEFAQEWLGDICHIMTMLSERLIERECDYCILFDALIEFSGFAVDRLEIAKAISKEERDDTVEMIDKAWEDKEIRFDEPVADQCPSSKPAIDLASIDITPSQDVPIKWHNAGGSQPSELTQNTRMSGL